MGFLPYRRQNLAVMRLNGTPARLAAVACCAALCVAVAACSSSHPSHAPASSAAPATGPAAVAAVKTTWVTFFNGAVPIPRRLGLLQDGGQFASFVRSQEKTSVLALVLQATATVSSVTIGPPGQASVRYTILLGGKPLEKNLLGTAVYDGGRWKMAVTTFCGLLHLAFGNKSRVLPAACQGGAGGA
jgi:hypothetical protein